MTKRTIIAYKDGRSHTTVVNEVDGKELKRKTNRAVSTYRLNDYTKITVNGIVKYEKK